MSNYLIEAASANTRPVKKGGQEKKDHGTYTMAALSSISFPLFLPTGHIYQSSSMRGCRVTNWLTSDCGNGHMFDWLRCLLARHWNTGRRVCVKLRVLCPVMTISAMILALWVWKHIVVDANVFIRFNTESLRWRDVIEVMFFRCVSTYRAWGYALSQVTWQTQCKVGQTVEANTCWRSLQSDETVER